MSLSPNLQDWALKNECFPSEDNDNYYITVESEYESPGNEKEKRLSEAVVVGVDKLLKFFLVNYKKKNEQFNLNINGTLNILNQKINFQNILANGNYDASEEDLRYFKNTFENILFDKDYLNILNLEKIKKFILEVS